MNQKMKMSFKERLISDKQIIERHLQAILPKSGRQQRVIDAMNYSLMAGGKRLRPILFMETLSLLGKSWDSYLDIAAAIEMIHTYSLIHDDLPAMDDDDLRRGKPTNHKVFGEANAILAGDALLNYAYEQMFRWLGEHPGQAQTSGCFEIAKAAGICGMVGGQAVDIESENRPIDEETMRYIHQNKTGALIEASMVSAARIAETSESKIRQIRIYAQQLGLLFQITDDILDVTGDETVLGKSIHRDARKGKATYPQFYGLEASKALAEETAKSAVYSLSSFGETADFFIQLTDTILNRRH